MRPQPVGDLKHVRASHRSPYGLIASSWRKDGAAFDWQIIVPANTTATVYVPANAPEAVTKSGKPASFVRGVEFLHMENGCAVLRVGNGSYHFASK